MTHEQIKSIEDRWEGRAKEFELKPGTKRYLKAQADFFSGAMAAAVAITSEREGLLPRWVFGIMRGDDLVKR